MIPGRRGKGSGQEEKGNTGVDKLVRRDKWKRQALRASEGRKIV